MRTSPYHPIHRITGIDRKQAKYRKVPVAQTTCDIRAVNCYLYRVKKFGTLVGHMTQASDQSHDETFLAEKTSLEIGVFAAVVSENDVSTPFWVAQVISLPEQSGSESQVIGVRWYQASGSSSDPYDAAYIPSVRKRYKDGTVTYWETSVLSSQVFYTFQALTSENRMDEKSAREIKGLLYQ